MDAIRRLIIARQAEWDGDVQTWIAGMLIGGHSISQYRIVGMCAEQRVAESMRLWEATGAIDELSDPGAIGQWLYSALRANRPAALVGVMVAPDEAVNALHPELASMGTIIDVDVTFVTDGVELAPQGAWSKDDGWRPRHMRSTD